MSRDQKSHDIKRVICGPTYSFPGTIWGSIDFASFSLRRCIEGLLWCPWCSKSWSRISGHVVFRVVGLGGNCNRRKFVCARRVLRLCPESPSWHLRNSKLPGSQRDNHFHDNIAGCSMFYYSLQKYIYYATCDMSPILLVSGLLAIYSWEEKSQLESKGQSNISPIYLQIEEVAFLR